LRLPNRTQRFAVFDRCQGVNPPVTSLATNAIRMMPSRTATAMEVTGRTDPR
jgi:hypothetical protein